jgi:type II secretory pathway component GspD/PulD (secretin)
VVMQIAEEIDDISGFTTIDGNPVPNTASKHLTSNVAVKDRDSIILGGAIYSEKDLTKSGVPLLSDIPILGALFSSRSSNKTRNELLVLMRPTVLKNPDDASLQAKIEEGRLPGIKTLDAQDTKEAARQVAAEKRLQQIQDAKDAKDDIKAKAKFDKLNLPVVPVIVPEEITNTPPPVPTIPPPAASSPKNMPATNPKNPAAGLY